MAKNIPGRRAVSTVTSVRRTRRDISGHRPPGPNGGLTVDKRKGEGVPALKNDDVTGMTEDRQEQVIRESGRAPRKKAAEEFFDEQEEQAAETKPEE